jgi:hypothetical protein
MMASRKTGAGVSRPRQMSGKKGSVMQFVFIGAAVVVVIVVVLLVFGGGGKKPAKAKARSKTASADEGMTRKERKSASASSARISRSDDKARRRDERLQRRQATRAGGSSRTSRSSDGGYSRGSSRSNQSDPSQLRAILTDGTGSRFALVGERRFKSGDDIEGRRIVEVTNDGVKVEYRQNTYTVKVGQKVY